MLSAWRVEGIAQAFPGYRPLLAYEAALPMYECALEVRLLRRQELSPVERLSLECLLSGIRTVEGVDLVLGAGRPLIRDTFATLLGADLIQPDGATDTVDRRAFSLTDAGMTAAADGGIATPVPYTLRVVMDGITGGLVPLLRDQFVNAADVRRRQLHIIPAAQPEPTAADLDRHAVQDFLRELRRIDPRRAPQGNLYDISALLGINIIYRQCDVVALDAQDESDLQFVVLENESPLPKYGPRLAGLFQRFPDVLPFTYREDDSETSAPTILDQELIRSIGEREQELAKLRASLELGEPVPEEGWGGPAALEVTLPAAGQVELEAREAQEKRVKELEKQGRKARFLAVGDHPPLLEKAFKHARERVIVLSPWLSDDVINVEFLELVDRALKRGVKIYIGWGMPERPGDRVEDQRSERRSLRNVDKLKQLNSKGRRGNLIIQRLGDTHEKVLIADERYAVVTSFNWLSFRGDPQRGFRQERGTYVEDRDEVARLVADLLPRFGSP